MACRWPMAGSYPRDRTDCGLSWSSKTGSTSTGATASSTLARAWLVALVILLVGLHDNDAGLAAAVLVVALFTVHFVLELAFRGQAGPEAPR